MTLPRRVSVDDIQRLCNYFANKPTGATIEEAKRVLEPKTLTQWDLPAMKTLGLLEEQDGRLKAFPSCYAIAKNRGAERAGVLANLLRGIAPYAAVIERAVLRGDTSLEAREVASYWNDHFKDETSSNELILREQVMCFFQLAEGAELGKFIIGRRGAPSSFEFNIDKVAEFTGSKDDMGDEGGGQSSDVSTNTEGREADQSGSRREVAEAEGDGRKLGIGIFIAHGKNKTPLEQLRKILDELKVPCMVAVEEPNLGRPIGTKIRQTMEACNSAILIFTADEEFRDKDGNIIWRPSENVVYELGAASYLYDNRIVILKEEGVHFPSNFSDLGYIPFKKDQLDVKTMDIIKELVGFHIIKFST